MPICINADWMRPKFSKTTKFASIPTACATDFCEVPLDVELIADDLVPESAMPDAAFLAFSA